MDIKYPIAPCILLLHYLVKHKCQQKQAINDKLQGSVATYARCGGIFKNALNCKFIKESSSENIL